MSTEPTNLREKGADTLFNIGQKMKSLKQKVLQDHLPKININFESNGKTIKLVKKPTPTTTTYDDFENHQTDTLIPLFSYNDSIQGTIDILFNDKTKILNFEEIAVYLIGMTTSEETKREHVFLSKKIILAQAANGHQRSLNESTQYEFIFKNIQCVRESFYGFIITQKYFLRVQILRPKFFQQSLELDSEFLIRNVSADIKRVMENPKKVKMQVGVDECLHIKFEYDNIYLVLSDKPNELHLSTLTGKITIIENTLKIRCMQIQLLQREIIKVNDISKPDILSTNLIGSFDIMDGMAIKDEVIPVKMPLKRFNNAIYTTTDNTQFKLRYYLNLGLVDEDGRRYFKTCEIFIYRL